MARHGVQAEKEAGDGLALELRDPPAAARTAALAVDPGLPGRRIIQARSLDDALHLPPAPRSARLVLQPPQEVLLKAGDPLVEGLAGDAEAAGGEGCNPCRSSPRR